MTHLLSDLLTATATRTPEACFLEMPDEAWTYAQTEDLAEGLARTLASQGVEPGDRVGIYLPKGIAAYGAIFATLKLGAVYVPLDPASPAARVGFVLQDCGVRALVSDRRRAEALLREVGEHHAVKVVILADDHDDSAGAIAPTVTPEEAPWQDVQVLSWSSATATSAQTETISASAKINNDNLAYVLYTSGSTGQPKGVMISHRGALAFVEWAVQALQIQADDRIAAVAALHFDLSVFDLFAAVATGATLLPLPPGILIKPQELTAWIAHQEISVWYSTPSTLILLLADGGLDRRAYPHLRRVLFAGEVFPMRHLRRLRQALPEAGLFNLYGPTETNVCTWYPVKTLPPQDDQTLPIGQACSGARLQVLNEDLQPVKDGLGGELWVCGPSVLQGYWGDTEKTNASLRNLPHLDSKEEGATEKPLWYRTGDLVHRDSNGDLHFHGRRDHMVKVRGYRVELGEVEAALLSHDRVREAAVVVMSDGDRGARLRAFVVPTETARYSLIQLKLHLGKRLPAYMIPAEIRTLDTLPKTSTEKIDRRALLTLA